MQRNKIAQRIKSLPPVAYMLVVLIVIFSVMSPNYLTLMNFKNVLIQATPLMIVAFGQTCIVLTQGTDLSLGAQVSFVTVFTVWMALRGIQLPAAMLLAILSTTLVGVVNGVIVAKGSIPPFIDLWNAEYTEQPFVTVGCRLFYLFSKFYIPYHYGDHDYWNTAYGMGRCIGIYHGVGGTEQDQVWNQYPWTGR